MGGKCPVRNSGYMRVITTACAMHLDNLGGRRFETMAERCAHAVCFCEPKGNPYCSTQCAQLALRNERRPTCECGHIDCEEATMRSGGVHTTGR